MSPDEALRTAVLACFAAPALALAAVAAPSFFRRPLPEGRAGAIVQTGMLSCLAALLAAALLWDRAGGAPAVLALGGGWVTGGAFAFDLVVDGWSLGFAILSVAICGVVSAFSFRYLHQERGFHRYFILLVAFVLGLLLVSLAGSIEVLYAGWEVMGLSSALLVAFFHERPAPVESGFRVLAFYRIGDACMLAAAALLHHWSGSGSLAMLFSRSGAEAALTPGHAAAIAVLLIAAAGAKSALLPFSTWLPRAMEGPTPSSAVYYGALSIHAGCFLLLRASPLLSQSPLARGLAASAGAATAIYAALVTRAQSDVKSRLCFSSLTQVGIIFVEIALGLKVLAFLHMVGNACYRLLQFLSAPNILHDIHELENDLGGSIAQAGAPAGASARWLYLLALERGFLDGMIERCIVQPVAQAVSRLDRLDRRLCGSLPGLAREAADGD
ncbi:MAG: oxidoreductase [Elusimicrobia bacterium]|nr:oxidoreductase [Elusimicrobiota bacterium]